jgi:hypothetical protein
MAVILRLDKMPEGCAECPLVHEEFTGEGKSINLWCGDIGEDCPDEGRRIDCPLIEESKEE